MQSVAAFTDTYLPTVNGVSYTVQTWRDHWRERDGRMDVVYPGTDDYVPDAGEYPVRSVSFPFYEGYRLGVPRVPSRVDDVDLVHAHTPFALGLSGLRLARQKNLPFIASYHTPTGEYADYLTSRDSFEQRIESLSERYERWFFGRADAVVCPSQATRDHLHNVVGVEGEVIVLSNGIDTDRFVPTDAADFRERYDLPDGPLVGYTGRHGYEKNLDEFLKAADGLDATVVFGGDGPAREELESLATKMGLDAHFLGFLPREELPAFYSALDAFVFPSPVETQGLVALEANACGTPVVGVNEGALSDTVVDGVTGYHYPLGDTDACRAAIERVLDERETLSKSCLERRDAVSVERAVDELSTLYDRVCAEKGY
ncbi:glycosyltransferase family 4 protein [Halogeometricum borinquense]|uniref:Glycosyltransferase family 4 protein n=1 Tax=Halogeometricum borinquense TaxID=60847 RepID=A0A482TB07_9EURY|nr:glycosyltransferase [Halogeometricum borinquense]RYJ13416.1 glycosyltransferase family 4 protein [Halogeometricum borinquense]